MGFERMGGDPVIIAPDLLEQDVAGYGLGALPVEIFEDRGFLVGEPHLGAVAGLQQLGGRLETILSDGEHRVFALVVLSQGRIDAREQHRIAERLGQVVIGSRLEASDLVSIFVVAGQHQHRALVALLAHQLDRFAAIHVGQADIENGQFDIALAQGTERIIGGAGLENFEVRLPPELLNQGLAQVRVVVHDKDASLIHCFLRSFPSEPDQGHIIATPFWPANHIGVIQLLATLEWAEKLQRPIRKSFPPPGQPTAGR